MSQEYTVGQRVGDYEILAVLGAGGMGKVYKVRNVISDRIEAMKVLLPNLGGQKELAERFLREIKVLASMNHPNIAALRTALTLDDQLVMIMEFVEGVTLSSRLQSGPLSTAEAVNYVDQVLAALSYAHRLNVVHRDIKPANMMLTPQGVVKLMDFGIARTEGDRSLTTTGTTLGSLNYMPPEQVNGEASDARSDIYSLGISLYEFVTGQLPFKGDSNFSLMAAHLTETPKPPIILRPDIPDTLNQIILTAIAKEPEKRFQSADAFREALKSVDTGAALGSEVTDYAMQSPNPSPASAPDGATQVSPGGSAPPVIFPTLIESARAAAAAAGPRKVVPPPPAAARNHRGLYVGLGALLVLGVLFAAALYLPRRAKTQANAEKPSVVSSAPVVQTGSPPEQQPAAQPASPAAEPPGAKPVNPPTEIPAAQPANPPPGVRAGNTPKSQPPSKSVSDTTKVQQDQQAQAKTEADARARAAAEAALEEAETQYDQLSARSSAVGQSLENMRKQQSAQGLGLRGDVASAQQRMDTNLARANSALQSKDPVKAKKYLESAEKDLEFLEKFLGR